MTRFSSVLALILGLLAACTEEAPASPPTPAPAPPPAAAAPPTAPAPTPTPAAPPAEAPAQAAAPALDLKPGTYPVLSPEWAKVRDFIIKTCPRPNMLFGYDCDVVVADLREVETYPSPECPGTLVVTATAATFTTKTCQNKTTVELMKGGNEWKVTALSMEEEEGG